MGSGMGGVLGALTEYIPLKQSPVQRDKSLSRHPKLCLYGFVKGTHERDNLVGIVISEHPIQAFRLRQQSFDDDIPRIDESFAAVQGVKGSVDKSEGSESLQNQHCVGYEGQIEQTEQIEQKISKTNQQSSDTLDQGMETVSEIYPEADIRFCSTEQQETEEKKEADVAFTPTQASHDKGLEPSQGSTLPFTNPTLFA